MAERRKFVNSVLAYIPQAILNNKQYFSSDSFAYIIGYSLSDKFDKENKLD